jgi:AcrR family transcriptional regulator
VAAALRILDRDGPDGLTMRALGRELGVDPMAAYHYVPNKAAILDGVVEAVWREIPLPTSEATEWVAWLRELGESVRGTLISHPNALPVLATRSNVSVPGFEVSEAALTVLLRAGFPIQEASEALNAFGHLVLGSALSEVGLPFQSEGDLSDEQIQAAIEEAGGAGRFPSLMMAIQGEVDFGPARSWRTGIEALLRGLEEQLKKLRKRQRERPALN